MKRGWKILIGVVVVLAALLILNTIAVDNETKGAETTIDGGRLITLSQGEIQVYEEEPEKRRVAADARRSPPIVLLHCYGCSLHWWDRMAPVLAERHRVIRIDLLGFGGSEKPAGGYSLPEQAAVVASALNRLEVEGAVVVGHSMGGSIATALAEQSSELVDRAVIIGAAPDPSYGDLGFLARLAHTPVIGQALWRLSPDFAVEDEYAQAFASGYEISSGFPNPDQVLDDYRAMTYTSFDRTHSEIDAYTEEAPLNERMARAAVPLMAIFGTEDQIVDAERALEAYGGVPGAVTAELPGAGHSPNVEKPERTARLVLEFAAGAGGLEEHPPGRRQGG
jgi:pimeloyl-ACP methyl ester carboxylesterase